MELCRQAVALPAPRQAPGARPAAPDRLHARRKGGIPPRLRAGVGRRAGTSASDDPAGTGSQRCSATGRRVAAGVWASRGRARRVAGGYRVSGRWAFCSGIMRSDYLFGGCMVQEGSGARRASGFIDTWHTSGLRGTGSHHAVADDVFVPDHRSLGLLDRPTSDVALYRFPIFGFFALSIAAAALGNARGAIDDLGVLAAGKIAQGSSRTLAQRPSARTAVAQAEASLCVAASSTTRRSPRRGRRPSPRSQCPWSCAPVLGGSPRRP